MATREILPHGLERERDLLLLIDSVTDYAIFLLDPGGHVVTWNAGAEHIHGYSAGEILGSHLSRFYPAEDVAAGKPERELVDAARVGRVEDEGWRLRKDGSRFWANVVVIALRGRGGELHGFGKVTRDLTERREADATQRELERQQVGRALAEDAAARERLLAQATSALWESLDYEATLGRLAGIVVPGLADWCAVHLLEGGTLVSLTIAHADPAKAALARK